MQDILERIKTLVGPENFMADHASRLVYARTVNYQAAPPDCDLPLAVVRPSHYSQLTKLLALCSAERVPLSFRGQGCLHVPEVNGAGGRLVVLSTGLDRIYEVDAANYSLCAQPGALCADIAEAAAKQGFFFPPAVAVAGPATIGGLLAVNEANSGFPKFGSAASYVAGMDFYATDGRLIHCAAASGLPQAYLTHEPLPQIFCGSRGGLGFIGDCVLRLEPAPASQTAMLWQFATAGAALAAANVCLAPEFCLPALLELYDPVCADLLAHKDAAPGWLLYAQWHNAAPGLRENLQAMPAFEHALSLPLPETFAAMRDCLWPLLMKRHGSFYKESIHCPPAFLPRFFADAQTCLEEEAIDAAFVLLPGLARVDMAIFAAGDRLATARKRLFALELMANERMAGENEADQGRERWQAGRDTDIQDLHRALARFCDPAGLLARTARDMA